MPAEVLRRKIAGKQTVEIKTERRRLSREGTRRDRSEVGQREREPE